MNEPPPNPITATFNVNAWIQSVSSGLSLATANTLFLSKTIASTAQGVISFVSGIKSNIITVYSGTSLTLRQLSGATVGIYNANVLNLIADPTDNSTTIPSTSWVNLWFANVLNTTELVWMLAQTFTLGVLTNSINPILSSGTLQIGQGSTTNNVEIASQVSRSTILQLGDGDTSSGGIHIGNGVNSSNNIQILNSSYTSTNVKGTLNIQTGASISALSTGGGFNLQSGSWNGVASIGNPSSRLDISCPTNILTGTDATSFCNILTGTMLAGTVAGQVNILTGTHNATTTGAAINMHTGSGCKGNCTIGGGSSIINLSAGTININRQLRLTYNPSAIPEGSLFLGSMKTPVYSTPFTLVANTPKTVASFSLGTGIFLINANIETPTGVTYQALSISTVTNVLQPECISNILTDGFQNFALNVCRVVSLSLASTIYVVAKAGDARTLVSCNVQATRIA